MIKFTATIEVDSRDPDKKGWSFILISKALSEKLNPGVRTGFRVKGKLDSHTIKQVALLPVSGERYMLPINASMRKATGKKAGDKLTVELELDKAKYKMNEDLLACLVDEPAADAHFKTLAPSHQRYFSKWIDDAKTAPTKEKRLILCISALSRKMDYGQMIREQHGR